MKKSVFYYNIFFYLLTCHILYQPLYKSDYILSSAMFLRLCVIYWFGDLQCGIKGKECGDLDTE